MVFQLPPKSQVGVLDPEIAGEGQKVILDSGEQVNWSPPPVKPAIPDWTQIKSIQRYFNRTNYPVFPAWLYHPTEEPRIVKNADEAAQLGVCYREATIDEKGRYGLSHVWDWTEDSLWRSKPYHTAAFDPQRPGTGKTFIASPANPAVAQHALLEALIPAVAAAVAKSLKTDGAAAPAAVDPQQWDEFLQFQAWKKSSEAVNALATDAEPLGTNALSGGVDLSDERTAWEDEAKRKGIKIDGRWSLDRLKAEVEKAA
jgi:hypothetical protein